MMILTKLKNFYDVAERLVWNGALYFHSLKDGNKWELYQAYVEDNVINEYNALQEKKRALMRENPFVNDPEFDGSCWNEYERFIDSHLSKEFQALEERRSEFMSEMPFDMIMRAHFEELFEHIVEQEHLDYEIHLQQGGDDRDDYYAEI